MGMETAIKVSTLPNDCQYDRKIDKKELEMAVDCNIGKVTCNETIT